MIEFELNGRPVSAADGSRSLLDTLREEFRLTSVKDGCSPQGQCGCCTVWVDGAPRVACVTPTSRVAGRSITTIDGLPDAAGWAERFCAEGATQCGFCTPGIIMRLAALDPAARASRQAVDKALLAHLCRCTGWQSIAVAAAAGPSAPRAVPPRDASAAGARAALEGGVPQSVDPAVALGHGGFADDEAPPDALVALRGVDGDWVVGDDLTDARRRAAKVQGRRTTAPPRWPIVLPDGEWARTLRTTWVEPAYLEPDASWCEPGGAPARPLGNGGAFGGKSSSPVDAVARRLADEHGRAVRVLASREDTVRLGPKRPPLAAGIRPDGTGVAHVARPAGTPDQAFGEPTDETSVVEAVGRVAPGFEVRFVDVPGPPVSTRLRGAVWAELVALQCVVAAPVGEIEGRGPADRAVAPSGAVAVARLDPPGEPGDRERLSVRVRCGAPLDETVLRSYCTGAAHMALGLVRSEFLAVADDGAPLDLTIRSFGVLRSADIPAIDIAIEPDDGPSVGGSDAVFAAVLAAVWRSDGLPDRWPSTAM